MARDVGAPWANAVPQARAPLMARDLEQLPDDAGGYALVEGRSVQMTPPGGERGRTSAWPEGGE